MVGVLVEHVGGEVLEERAAERRAVLAAVDGMAAVAAELVAVLHPLQLVDALVELVVADADDVEADRVHRLDRRLVVEERRDERARADQVACADRDRVRVRRPQPLDVRGEVGDAARRHGLLRPAGLHAAGELMGLQQPTWIVPGVFGARCPCRSLIASSWTCLSFAFSFLAGSAWATWATASAASASPRMRAPLRAREICM